MPSDAPQPGDDPTATSAGRRESLEPSTPSAAPTRQLRAPDHQSPQIDLAPGELIAGRYRIVSRLGAGGMGEVYRADDLTLGAPVALKFLPPSLGKHPGRVDRFRAEVRVSRQVSHPNVVRVFDISEDAGRVFLSMEYIDGEDLASLLRRIGRLPHDKSVELARQICFGLHAAHDKGLIHRDLKPANIMIDGRGNARVTDFGISGIAEDLHAKGDIQAGTPAYMAPEQLDGTDISKRSDLYSLGLVLYELFTGRPAYSAQSLAQLRDLRRTSSRPTNPSSLVKDIDPAVERVILHCLEPDPDDRPSSAIAVAAALPGGDPLAAALAAGELPSPELVAAAGPARGMPLKWALCVLLVMLLGIAGSWVLHDKATLNGLAQFDHSPEVMRSKSRDMLRELGITDDNPGWASGFGFRRSLRLQLRDMNLTAAQQRDLLQRGPASLLWFWYAASPAPIPATNGSTNYIASIDELPLGRPGLSLVILDPSGRLLGLSRYVGTGALEPPASPVDWPKVFRLAGLDIGDFEPTPASGTAGVPADEVLAWKERQRSGGWGPLGPRLITAATAAGQLTAFEVRWEYTFKPIDTLPNPPWYTRAASVATSVLEGLVALGVLILAVYQVRTRRADLHGAFRLALVVFFLRWLGGVFSTERFTAIFDTSVVIDRLVPSALFTAAYLWIYYLSLEPIVRRARPQLLVTWSRLMSGRVTDPVVGRDLLVGAMGGALLQCAALAGKACDGFFNGPTSLSVSRQEPFRTFSSALAQAASIVPSGIVTALFVCIVYSIALLLLRRQWAALAVTFFVGLLFPLGQTETLAGNLVAALAVVMVVALMARFGVLTAVVLTVTFYMLDVPFTLDVGNWLFPNLLPALLLVIGVAVFGLVITTRRAAVAAQRST